MFGVTVKTEDKTKAIGQAVEKTAYRNFGHAAASIAKFAKQSIKKSDEPSAEGEPPHTRRQAGHNLPGAIRYKASKIDAVIGPMASIVGEAGAAHEFGGEFRGTTFPERPFMWPALQANLARFHRDWGGSI